ncbi:MAG: tetratricopeptide repeat protein [Bacteriovoracaceae bacterium]|nr:tetratricopeptide repeat protein [Bacteriovoracaceae bacterium]
MKDLTGSPLLIRYQKAHEENPKSRVFAPLAEAYRKLGMIDKAQEILLKGIKIHPNYSLGYLGLAHCYADLSQYKKVYETLKDFAKNDRDNLKLQKLFADACMRIGKETDALETFKYLLFINPKDTKIANYVKALEQENETDESANSEKPSTIFEIDKISSNPEQYNYDDWRQQDFAFADKTQDMDDHEWAMTESTPVTLDSSIENSEDGEREYVVNTSLIDRPPPISDNLEDVKNLVKITDDKDIEEPIVTHTLVDLYCAQGYLEKARVILEKILILNPTDKITKEKIIEINDLLGDHSINLSDDKEQEVEDLQESEFLKPMERELDENQAEKQGLKNYFDSKISIITSDNVNLKVNKLQLFLAKIKERAKNRAPRASGTTP